MKKMFVLSVLLAGTLMVSPRANAKAVLSYSSSQGEKTKIKKEELPEPVLKKLKGDAFKGWVVVNAFKIGGAEYEVELKKGDTTQVLKFDKDGNPK